MLEDHFVQPVAVPPPPSEEDNQTLLSRIESMQTLASALQKRVMPDGRTIPKDINIREAKEAIAASSTLASLLMRHRDLLELEQDALIFREAVAATLQEMDRALNTQFEQKMRKHLTRLQPAK